MSDDDQAARAGCEHAAPAAAEGETDAPPSGPAAVAPPRKTSPWKILAPGLLAPALALSLFGLGAPQELLRSVSGEDSREPNDTISEAVTLEAGRASGMRCGPGDVDWYKVIIPPGKCLQLKTAPPPTAEGATSIHSLDGTIRALAPNDEARCVYAPRDLQGEEVRVRVWGARSQPYQLDVAFVDASQRYEPNDDPSDATPIELGEHERLSCDGSDWYRVRVPAWRPLTASLKGATPGLGLRVLPTTVGLPEATTDSLPARVEVPAVAATRPLLIQVVGRGGYELALQAGESQAVAPPSAPPLPLFKGDLEPNQSKAEAKQLVPGRYRQLRCDGEDWYWILLEGDTSLSCSLDYAPRRGDLKVELEPEGGGLQWGRRSGSSRQACYYTELRRKVWLKVSSSSPSLPYQMTVELRAGPPGSPLGPGEYADLVCDGTELWRVEAEEGQALTVEATWEPADGWLVMQVRSARGGELSVSSASPDGSERVTFVSGSDQKVLIQLSGALMRYRLRVATSKAAGWSAGFNPMQHLVGAGVYPKRKLQRERYYALKLEGGDRVAAEVCFDDSLGAVGLEALAEDGLTLATGSGAAGSESIEYTAQRTQLIYLRASTFQPGPLEYELTVAINERTRPHAQELRAPTVKRVRKNLGDTVYRVPLRKGERLTARVDFVGDGDQDLDMTIQDGNGLLVREASSHESHETLDYEAPGDGDVFVRVYGGLIPFDLTLSLEQTTPGANAAAPEDADPPKRPAPVPSQGE